MKRWPINTALSCALLIVLAACAGGPGSGSPAPALDSPAGAPAINLSTPELRELNALGEAQSGASQPLLAMTPDGQRYVVSSTPAESRHSIYLELLSDPRLGQPTVELLPLLQERALTLSIAAAPGSTHIAVAMIGPAARIPAASELISIRFDGALAAMPARSASAVSIAPVTDFYFEEPDLEVMRWTYYGNGDYDQNGEVNIADLTPIGIYFGYVSTDSDWPRGRVADGDNNGEVNISDITPIGVNFGTSVDGFRILSSPNPAGPFLPVEGATVPYSAGVQPQNGGPRLWSYSLVDPPYGHYFVVVPFEGEFNGTASGNPIRYLPSNIPPEAAAFHNAAPLVQPGTLVSFNASDSYDPDGTLTKYEWDPENTGNWTSSGDSPLFEFTYTGSGSFAPLLRVTDNNNRTAVYSMSGFTVGYGTPRPSLLFSAGEGTAPISASLLGDGRPALVFLLPYQTFFNTAYIVRASSASGLSWEVPELALISPTQCDEISLCRAGGSLHSFVGLSGKFCRADYADGGSGSALEIEMLDEHPLVDKGFQISAFDLLNAPAAAYLEGALAGSGPLLFTGEALGYLPQLVDPVASADPSAFSLPGGPALAYTRLLSEDSRDLVFRQALDAEGDEWGNGVVLAAGRGAHTSERCAVVAGGSIIAAFFSSTDNALYSVASTDLAGTDWGTPQLIAAGVNTGSNFTLRLINGLPAIAYSAGSGLHYATARNTAAGSWNPAQELATSHGGFGETDMLDLGGKPLIFHVEPATGRIHALTFAEE